MHKTSMPNELNRLTLQTRASHIQVLFYLHILIAHRACYCVFAFSNRPCYTFSSSHNTVYYYDTLVACNYRQ